MIDGRDVDMIVLGECVSIVIVRRWKSDTKRGGRTPPFKHVAW